MEKPSYAIRLLTKAILNVLLVWVLSLVLPDYFIVTGGWVAYIIIGALITLLNILVRPILALITLPLKMLATVLAVIIVNGIFVWIVHYISLNYLDVNLVTLDIGGGIGGWIVVSLAFGIANWLIKVSLK